MKKNKIVNILYLFILFQPILDILTSLMTRFLDTRFTIGILIRGILFIASVIYILFLSKSKYKKQSTIYLIVLALFSILYFVTKPSIFTNTSFIVTEVIYMFKYYYSLVLLLLLFNLFDEFKPNNRRIFKLLQIELFLYCLSIVLANITGTAFGTYSGGSGNTGWFYAGNEIGIIVALLFPLLFLLINKSNSYSVLLYIIPIILGIEIIGTKTSMLGLILPSIIFFFYYLIRIKKGKFKQFIMTFVILFVIVISSPNLPVIQNIKNSINRYEVRENNSSLDGDYSDEVVSTVILSDRDYFNRKMVKIYTNSSIVDKLFGVGFVNRIEINDKNIEKLIEMDYHDIFYRYGIVGFIIYVLPLIVISFKVLQLCLKNKFKLNMKQLVLGYISYVGLAIAAIVGHTLGAPAVIFYVDLALVLLIYYLENGQYKIDIDDNKVTILALHLGTGGIEKYISDLCKMIDKKYKVEIVSTYKMDEKPAFDFSNRVNIKYLINDYPHRKEFNNAINGKNVFDIIKYGFGLVKIYILRYLKNVLYIEEVNSKYIIATRTFHNKLVGSNKNRDTIAIATEHNYHNNDKKYIKKLCESCNNIDYLVLVSEELRDFYSSKLKDTKCIYIPNVIDNISEYRKKEKINNKLISVGRLVEEKGYEDLVDIINIVKKDIPNIKLDIYGDGKLKDKLEEKIKELNLDNNIKLCGFCNYNELIKKFKNYDLYTMTSYTESFGLVLLEAMSESVCCIGFDSANGVKTLLKDGSGVLISNRSKEDYAKEIVKLLRDKDKLNFLSKKGYEKVKEFDIKKIEKMWTNLLSNTVVEENNNETAKK